MGKNFYLRMCEDCGFEQLEDTDGIIYFDSKDSEDYRHGFTAGLDAARFSFYAESFTEDELCPRCNPEIDSNQQKQGDSYE